MILAPTLSDDELARLPFEEDALLLLPTRCPDCRDRLSLIRWQLGVRRGVKLSPYCLACNARIGDTVLARLRTEVTFT